MKKLINYAPLLFKVIVALILVQTLYFKFTAHPDSVFIFTEAGMEPYGRVGIGVLELIASILLFIPRFTHFGAVLALGLMSGAIFIHLTKIGIVVNDDNGGLFTMALITFILSGVLTWIDKDKLLNLFKSQA